MTIVGRNDPCPCGSGRKYKKCCLGQELGRLLIEEAIEAFDQAFLMHISAQHDVDDIADKGSDMGHAILLDQQRIAEFQSALIYAHAVQCPPDRLRSVREGDDAPTLDPFFVQQLIQAHPSHPQLVIFHDFHQPLIIDEIEVWASLFIPTLDCIKMYTLTQFQSLPLILQLDLASNEQDQELVRQAAWTKDGELRSSNDIWGKWAVYLAPWIMQGLVQADPIVVTPWLESFDEEMSPSDPE